MPDMLSTDDGRSGPVVVALDGSDASNPAAMCAMALARMTGAPLILRSNEEAATPWAEGAALPPPANGTGGASARITASPRELEQAARAFGVSLERRPAQGNLAAAALAEATANDTAMVVVPAHGDDRPGCAFGRGATEHLLRHARAPVVLVPATARRRRFDQPIRRLLTPLDCSSLAETALEPAVRLARGGAAEVILIHVVPPAAGAARYSLTYSPMMHVAAHRYLRAIADRLWGDGLQVQTATTSGFVGPEIASFARQRQADMIVMATHARSGLARLLVGSHAIRTFQHATVPIMVVGPLAARRYRGESSSRAYPLHLGVEEHRSASGNETAASR
jgi:nucleotide-binding universal stress UspA family protein